MTFKEDLITDLPIFVDPNDFGKVATYKGNPVNIQFYSVFEEISPMESGIESKRTWALAKTDDVAGAVHGDTLTVDGTVYTIMGIEHEDGDLSVLRLSL